MPAASGLVGECQYHESVLAVNVITPTFSALDDSIIFLRLLGLLCSLKLQKEEGWT